MNSDLGIRKAVTKATLDAIGLIELYQELHGKDTATDMLYGFVNNWKLEVPHEKAMKIKHFREI